MRFGAVVLCALMAAPAAAAPCSADFGAFVTAMKAEALAQGLLPQGRTGQAFLAYANFRVLFEWNKSFVYVTTAAFFATRLDGADVYDAGALDAALSPEQMIPLQEKLGAPGYDVGKIDGILGAATRNAVQQEQARLGLPADAWPTVELLEGLSCGDRWASMALTIRSMGALRKGKVSVV